MARATVFIGDLSRFCSDEDISSLFRPFGEILEIKIMRNPATGISLGYGFLIMGSTESALLAMQCLHGVQLRGRPLRVKWAGRNIKHDPSSSSSPGYPRDVTSTTAINSVHVRFQALHISSLHFTEESLYQFFLPYGEVTDASIKESTVDEQTGLQNGYGFVHFNSTPNGADCACRAIEQATGDIYFVLTCEGSRNFMKQFRGSDAHETIPQLTRSTLTAARTSTSPLNQKEYCVPQGKIIAPINEFNLPSGVHYNQVPHQVLPTPHGSDQFSYPPAPFAQPQYCYAPSSSYMPVSPTNMPVMLAPPPYPQHSNTVGIPHQSYMVPYPFFPPGTPSPVSSPNQFFPSSRHPVISPGTAPSHINTGGHYKRGVPTLGPNSGPNGRNGPNQGPNLSPHSGPNLGPNSGPKPVSLGSLRGPGPHYQSDSPSQASFNPYRQRDRAQFDRGHVTYIPRENQIQSVPVSKNSVP